MNMRIFSRDFYVSSSRTFLSEENISIQINLILNMLCFQDCYVPLPCDILCLQLTLLDLLSDSGQHLWPQLVLNSLPQILETIVDNSDSMEALPTTKQVCVFFVFSCWFYNWVFHSVWFDNNWNLIAMTSLTWLWFANIWTWIHLYQLSLRNCI